jgi:phosphatidylglycerophosphatase A
LLDVWCFSSHPGTDTKTRKRGPNALARDGILPRRGSVIGEPIHKPGRSADAPAPARRSFAVWVAVVGGAGYGPAAPGTFGSGVGVILFLLLSSLALPVYVLTVVAISALGVWASTAAEAFFGQPDDGRIVIDEVAGQLVTLTPLLLLRTRVGEEGIWANVGSTEFILWVVTGFVVFRCLDIWKPGPIGWAERNYHGGWGVMADDLIAGLMGAVLLALVLFALGSGVAIGGGVP